MRVCAAGVSRISTISTHLCQAQAVEVEVWSVVPGKIVHDWVGTNSKKLGDLCFILISRFERANSKL